VNVKRNLRNPMTLSSIEALLATSYPPILAKELLGAYGELKRNFSLGNLRPNEVEGGRFAEAAFRMLQTHLGGVPFTPLNDSLDTEGTIRTLASTPRGSIPDAIRLHIPRSLRVVYDIRNNRDVAHLADGIDPNLQDSTLVTIICDWVLAEFVRLTKGISAAEAHKIIDDLVTRVVPVVQDFDGFLKTLNPNLGPSERVLVLLNHAGENGLTIGEIKSYLKPSMRHNLKRTLDSMEHKEDHIVQMEQVVRITKRGIGSVETRKLFLNE
jgi:hypothetical protein